MLSYLKTAIHELSLPKGWKFAAMLAVLVFLTLLLSREAYLHGSAFLNIKGQPFADEAISLFVFILCLGVIYGYALSTLYGISPLAALGEGIAWSFATYFLGQVVMVFLGLVSTLLYIFSPLLSFVVSFLLNALFLPWLILPLFMGAKDDGIMKGLLNTLSKTFSKKQFFYGLVVELLVILLFILSVVFTYYLPSLVASVLTLLLVGAALAYIFYVAKALVS